MPGSELDRALDRARRRQEQSAAEARTSRAASAAAAGPRGLTFTVGTRVFDTVSGEEGVVIDGTRQNIVLPPGGRDNG